MDQSCEVFSKRNHLLYLDTLDDSYELVLISPAMKQYKIVIFFSGLERALAGSKFNMRVDELKSAAYALMAFSGMGYGEFEEHDFALFLARSIINTKIGCLRTGENEPNISTRN